MSRVEISYQAGRDLEEIEDFISRDNPDAAAQLIQEILEKCELLSRHPQAGDDRSELHPGLRGFPVGNYLIFYSLPSDGIIVVRIIHGARDVPKLFE
jgi:toxin ParE1/3/4